MEEVVLYKMKGFTPAVIITVALCLNIARVSSSPTFGAEDYSSSNHATKIVKRDTWAAGINAGFEDFGNGKYYVRTYTSKDDGHGTNKVNHYSFGVDDDGNFYERSDNSDSDDFMDYDNNFNDFDDIDLENNEYESNDFNNWGSKNRDHKNKNRHENDDYNVNYFDDVDLENNEYENDDFNNRGPKNRGHKNKNRHENDDYDVNYFDDVDLENNEYENNDFNSWGSKNRGHKNKNRHNDDDYSGNDLNYVDIENDDYEDNESVDDEFFKWLNPTDGYLAAESTPIYLIESKGNSNPKIRSHKLGKYLDDIYSYSYGATVDSFIENTKKQRGRAHNIINTSVSRKTIYPEILVVVDYSLFNSFKKNMLQILTYILGFWNGVDMRYRIIEDPKVRLNIAGIVIAQDDAALSYLKRSSSVDAHSVINTIGSFFKKYKSIIPLKSYDIITHMTARKLCSNSFFGSCKKIAGMSVVGASCHGSSWFGSDQKSSIIHDDGGFEGILTATHELGHLFGISHDGEDQNGRCSASDHIMAAVSRHFTKNNSKWTSCSVKNLQDYLRKNDVSCLYNKPPNGGKRAKRFFPGKLMDTNLQCEKRQNMRAVTGHNSCESLDCSKREMFGISSSIHMSVSDDGRSCGNGKICLLNQCI